MANLESVISINACFEKIQSSRGQDLFFVVIAVPRYERFQKLVLATSYCETGTPSLVDPANNTPRKARNACMAHASPTCPTAHPFVGWENVHGNVKFLAYNQYFVFPIFQAGINNVRKRAPHPKHIISSKI